MRIAARLVLAHPLAADEFGYRDASTIGGDP
jgi:hypothetical protein